MPGPQLIGRDRETVAGQAGLDLLVGGDDGPAVCVIEGEPGIGKSALWRSLVEDATNRGWRVLATHPVHAETRVSMAAFSDLFASVRPDEMVRLPAVQRDAINVALLRAEPVGVPPDLRSVGTAAAGLLRDLARGGSVLVAIDDVPWLDGPSHRTLAFAARRLGSAGIAFLLSTRPMPGAPDPLGLTDVVDETRRVSIRLGPLTVAAIHDLLLARTGMRLPRPQLLRLHRLSGGNPFYALELARMVAAGGYEAALRTDLGIEHGLTRLPGVRISGLPRPTRDILFVASAMSEPTLSAVARVLGEQDVRAGLQPAIEAGIVPRARDRITFTHPLLAAAAYAAKPGDARVELHRRMSEFVQDPEERARNVALAQLQPSDSVAAILDGGAHRAALRGAPDAAGQLAEAAIDHTPASSGAARCERILQAAAYHIEAGDLARARLLCEGLIATSEPGPVRGQVLSLLGQISFQEVSFTEATKLLTQALDELGDDPRAIAVEIALNFVWNQTGDLRRARDYSRAAVSRATATGIPGLQGSALALDYITAVQAGDDIDKDTIAMALEVAKSDEPALYFMRPAFVAGVVASWEGRSAEARVSLTAMAQELIDRGHDALLPFVSLWLVGNELQLGDVDAAARYAARSLEAAEQVGDVFRAVALTGTGWVAAMVGDVTVAQRSAIQSREAFAAAGWRSALLWPDATLGAVEWSLGNAAAADSLFAPMIELSDEIGILDPSLRPFMVDEIEALVALGRIAEAEVLTAGLERDAIRVGRPRTHAVARRCRGLVLAASGEPEAGLASLEEAVGWHGQGEPLPFDLARTLLAKGMVERRLKRKSEARRSLDSATELFTGLGAERWLDRTRAELARLGGRPVSLDTLTETEAQVAELAGRGLSNKQVAEALFLAPKSVEGVLSRVYSKLGIHSRAELGAWAASDRQHPGPQGPPTPQMDRDSTRS